jgi:L-ascorbate metabolism protein UlaG (beta-lactamase superfamily)
MAWAYRAAPIYFQRLTEDRKRAIRPAPHRPTPHAWPDRGLHAAWLGHTTVLLKLDGFTILTDPVLSPRIGLNFGLMTIGLKRLVAPALDFQELPKINLVLLSHAHFDHFDRPTLRLLESRGTTVVTATRTRDLLRAHRYRAVHELGWREGVTVGPAEIRAFGVKHWGARMRTDQYRGYNGYTIQAGRYRVLFGGDTAFTPVFADLKSARRFDMAIMPVGAYNPWIHYHCTPEQAWQMAEEARSEFFLPVHHQTFALSQEPYLEPVERLYQAAGRQAERIVLDSIGQEFHLL